MEIRQYIISELIKNSYEQYEEVGIFTAKSHNAALNKFFIKKQLKIRFKEIYWDKPKCFKIFKVKIKNPKIETEYVTERIWS